ncbi:hypothetical protein HDK77DRAFT_373669 [Phyllosticta capitalensis]
MRIHTSLFVLFWTAQTVFAAITADSIKTSVDSFSLQFPFNPIKDLYWTGMKTHRRVCFAASPSGDAGYVAYLDASGKGVHVQQVNLQTFEAVGDAFTIPDGREAGGIVAQEQGVAILTNEPLPEGTQDAPPPNDAGQPTPVPVLYRIIDGEVKWKVFLAGPGLHPDPGLGAAVDMNGDLTYSPVKKLYGAYFVISYYTGEGAKGHFSDSIQYVDEDGQIQDIKGATSAGGCSHNTGIAFEEADDAPFCSACAEDQTGTVWLNTKNQGEGPPAVPLSVEPFINGMSGEPFNGMGGSWSVLTRLGKSQSYAITWLTRNTELKASPKGTGTETNTNTNTNTGTVPQDGTVDQTTQDQKTDTTQQMDIVGAKNVITQPPADHFNTHIQAFDEKTLLSTYEEITSPQCVKAAGCLGTWAGTYFAQVDGTTAQVDGEAFKSTEVFVGGDLVLLPNGICFPYVNMKWDTSTKVDGSGGTGDQGVMMGNGQQAANTQKLSFACVANPSGTTTTTGGGGGGGGTTTTNEGANQGNVKKPLDTQQQQTKQQATTDETTTTGKLSVLFSTSSCSSPFHSIQSTGVWICADFALPSDNTNNALHKRRMRRFLGRNSSPRL